MFNLDNITTKNDNQSWPINQTIYLIQFKKTIP